MASASALKAMGEVPTIEDIAISYWFILHNPGCETNGRKQLPAQFADWLSTLPKSDFLNALDVLHRDGKITSFQ